MAVLTSGSIAFLLFLSALSLCARADAPLSTSSMSQLKAASLAALSKVDSHSTELVTKAESYVEAVKKAKANSPLPAKLENAVQHISCGSANSSEVQIKSDLELLDAICRDHKEPSVEDLAALQERYKLLCVKLEDLIFVKDLESAFRIHDRFVRYTSLALWDKEKILAELERMERAADSAPQRSPAQAKLVSDLKGKRISFSDHRLDIGTAPDEQMYLTTDRRSNSLIGPPCLELVEHLIQSPDGRRVDFNDCNIPALGIPFSPPITLWVKSRTAAGHVPAVLLNFVDIDITSSNPVYFNSTANFSSIADVVEGKLDDYLKDNMKLIAADKTPALIGFCSDFDREVVSNAFGADGRTPYFFILEPKLKDMAESERIKLIEKRQAEGFYTKADSTELSNKYGDKTIPDGPERVRDAWKRTRKILTESGGSAVGMFCCAGNFHGNKEACKFAGELKTGNQPWNDLKYYYPGEGVFDYAGINAMGDDAQRDPDGPNIMAALKPFMSEVRTSAWHSTPVLLIELSPGRTKMPFEEAAWIKAIFTEVTATYPNIGAVTVTVPDGVTFWTPESLAVYRRLVIDGEFNYKSCVFGKVDEK
ncbi:MAG: hypothetical protein JST89_17525 [Cyanobacteria bacterium SZAS-4]|nr:hypothetical protein [Cyanobacteria bacterium SZAS-4]